MLSVTAAVGRGWDEGKRRESKDSVSVCQHVGMPCCRLKPRTTWQEKERAEALIAREGALNPLAQILDALICSSERGGLDKYRDDSQNHELIRRLTRETNVCLERGGGGRLRSLLLHSRKFNVRGRQNKTCDLLTTFFFPAVKGWEKCMQCFMDFPIRVAFYAFLATVSGQVHVCTGVDVKMTKPYDTVDRLIILLVLTDP